MDLIDQLRAIGDRIRRSKDAISTEEATKNAFVMPFLQALGYDVFDPHEVVPEYTADVGLKKGEKVDYAVMREDEPIILVECKWSGCDLDEQHVGQLFRYFSVTPARLAVLTNGIVYKFFTDLDAANKMDDKPFLVLDLLDLREAHVEELKKVTKQSFNIEQLLEAASDLKYLGAFRRLIRSEMRNPSDELVKLLGKRVYSGLLTQSVRDQLRDIIRRAFTQVISERLQGRLQAALAQEEDTETKAELGEAGGGEEAEPEGEPDNGIVTTEEEWEGFLIVKGLLRPAVDISRVSPRDTKSYFGILLDDNNRQPLCRLHFNRAQKYLGVFDTKKKETRIPIDSLDDLYGPCRSYPCDGLPL